MKQEPTENKIYFKSYYAILVSYVEIYYSGNVAMEINLMLSLATKSTYIYLLILASRTFLGKSKSASTRDAKNDVPHVISESTVRNRAFLLYSFK